MKKWNLSSRQPKASHSSTHDQERNKHDHSAENLRRRREQRLGFFRFRSSDYGRDRHSQFAAKGLAALDFGKTVPNFLFKQNRILWALLRIFLQHVRKQATQRLGRAAQFRQASRAESSFLAERHRAGKQKTHRRAKRVDFRAEIQCATLQLLRTGELRRDRR